MADLQTRNDPEQQRYEASVDGEVIGFAEYRFHDGIIEFTHTEVDEASEGAGVGSTLVRVALDDVRRDGGRKVKASCPFVAAWIDQHPDYQDLLV